MALEQALQENTKAVLALSANLEKVLSSEAQKDKPAPAETEKPKKEAKKSAPKKEEPKAEEAEDSELSKKGGEKSPYYQEIVKPKTLEFVKQDPANRAVLDALFEEFGVGSAKDLTADQYEEYAGRLDDLLSGEAEDDVA